MDKQPQLKLTDPTLVCDQCKSADGVIQYVAICRRGRLEVHNAWLHSHCEQEYLAAIGH